MLNVYKFHTDPESLIQQGIQANLQEVYNHIHSTLEQYTFYFNEDPDDSGEQVELTTSVDDDDMYKIVLSFKRDERTFKRITVAILQRQDNIAVAGRNASVEEKRPFTRNIMAYDHGLFDEELVDNFVEELLHPVLHYGF